MVQKVKTDFPILVSVWPLVGTKEQKQPQRVIPKVELLMCTNLNKFSSIWWFMYVPYGASKPYSIYFLGPIKKSKLSVQKWQKVT